MLENDEAEPEEPSLIDDLLAIEDEPPKERKGKARKGDDEPAGFIRGNVVPAAVTIKGLTTVPAWSGDRPGKNEDRPGTPYTTRVPAREGSRVARTTATTPLPREDPPRDAIVAWFKDLEKGLNARVDQRIETLLTNSLETRVKDMVLRGLVEQVKSLVLFDMKRTFQAQVDAVKQGTVSEVSSAVRVDLARDMVLAREITSKLLGTHERFKQVIKDEIVPELGAAIREEVQRDAVVMRSASRSLLSNIDGFKRDIKNMLKGELKGELTHALSEDLVHRFKDEIKGELLREIKDELEGPTTVELASKATEMALPSINEQVGERVAKRAASIAAGMDVAPPVHLVFIDFNNIVVLGTNYHGKLDFNKVLEAINDALDGTGHDPGQVIGHVFYSKQHELDATNVRVLPPSAVDPLRNRMKWHLVAGRKMRQESNTTGYRDVDVALAVKAAAIIAGTTNVASITIASGDGDYKPLFKLAKKRGIYTILACFKQGSSKELRHLADKVAYINGR